MNTEMLTSTKKTTKNEDNPKQLSPVPASAELSSIPDISNLSSNF